MFVLCCPRRGVSDSGSGTPRLSDPSALPPMCTCFVSRLLNEPGCCAEVAPCSLVRVRATLNTDHAGALPAFLARSSTTEEHGRIVPASGNTPGTGSTAAPQEPRPGLEKLACLEGCQLVGMEESYLKIPRRL